MAHRRDEFDDDLHGAQFAQVLGDQGKPGLYVVRVKFPPHLMDTPHWRPNDRYVMVLQGIWYTDTGPIFDPAVVRQMALNSLQQPLQKATG